MTPHTHLLTYILKFLSGQIPSLTTSKQWFSVHSALFFIPQTAMTQLRLPSLTKLRWCGLPNKTQCQCQCTRSHSIFLRSARSSDPRLCVFVIRRLFEAKYWLLRGQLWQGWEWDLSSNPCRSGRSNSCQGDSRNIMGNPLSSSEVHGF